MSFSSIILTNKKAYVDQQHLHVQTMSNYICLLLQPIPYGQMLPGIRKCRLEIKCKDKRSNPVLRQKPVYFQKIKMSRANTKDATKNFDQTAIADRLRLVNWSNYCCL